MAMTYASLTGSKTQSGSIAGWVNYTLLDVPPIVDESQSLLYSILRCREMMTRLTFTMPQYSSSIELPTGFLDPIGRIELSSFSTSVRHKDANFIQLNRVYTELSGALGTNPFTTTSGSNMVAVALANHGFNAGSIFYTTGATASGGVTIAGTFPVTSIIDANDFNIDITNLGATPTGSGAGGGSAVSYTCDNLQAGLPAWYGIWDERIHFDMAFFQTGLCALQYYQSPPLLSATNQSNFLTNRYPRLLRQSCITMAADFMKDDVQYQKNLAALTAMVEQVNVENDMQYRGMELDTFTP
jgi:hypothetical protein